MSDPAIPLPATQAGVPFSPLARYRARVARGALDPDPAQARAAERLDALSRALAAQPPGPDAGIRARARPPVRLFGLGRRPDPAAARPRGLYLVGGVGLGKSMLMDLFFETAPVARKRRIHFHRFMQDTHAALHRARARAVADPIPPLAETVAADAALLCFDEFQINDIADALILGRLFEALFARGVAVVATSNVRPERLFQDRPGADAFRPFIAILLRHLDVLDMAGGRDYRRGRRVAGATWHTPLGLAADRLMDAAFDTLADGAPPCPARLPVFGRTVAVPAAANGVARFHFEDLCGQPLGPGDFLAIARAYPSVLIDRIPHLGPGNVDRARRFITLIDALYEARVKLVASAEAAPDGLLEGGTEAQAFARTASRLAEMQSEDYRDLPHLV